MTVVVAGLQISSVRELISTQPSRQIDISKFRYWHVEPLLNQAADLLDRVIAAQATYNQLRLDWYQARQALIEADRAQMLTEELKKRGLLDQDSSCIVCRNKSKRDYPKQLHRGK